MTFVTVLATIGFVLLLAVVFTFAYAGLRAAPWVPTFARDVARFLRVASLAPGERFYDLGCGDGRLVAAAADAGADAVGYECSLLPYALSWLRPSARGRVRYRDFWRRDLRDADVVYCFLMPAVLPKLREKLARECAPGTRVISYVWPLEGWEPTHIDVADGQSTLYMYTVRG